MINPQEIRQQLLSMADPDYKQFQCKLMPTVDSALVIGIRIPQLRNYAKTLRGEYDLFLNSLPHKYYEENNLHGIILSEYTNANSAIAELDRFLPHVDNWATCDLIAPKAFKKYPNYLIPKVFQWLKSEHTYTVRFAIGVLLRYYLDDKFDPVHLEIVSKTYSQQYYVKMMIAWYFATALAKQYEATLPYIQNNCLDKWTHNKAIQKAIESYRITAETKVYLRSLKQRE